MYCARPVARSSPGMIRIVSPRSSTSRNASFFPSPFFPRAAASADLAPFFRLLEDFPSTLAQTHAQHAQHARQAQAPPAPQFNPRFDVREIGQSYELRGEVPGVEGDDLHVEFTDPQTLIVRGRTERESSSSSSATPAPEPAAIEASEQSVVAETAPAADDSSDAASTYSTGSYQRPSVEDGDAEAESSADAQGKATPTESVRPEEQQPEQQESAVEKQPQQQQQEQQAHYWVAERSTGSFERVFKFPARVDQDAVKASLRNGILSIVVPKAAPPVARRISVQ